MSEKNKILSEISKIRGEIDQKISLQEKKIEKDVNTFNEMRSKEITLEIDQFKNELEKQFERDVSAYRQRLEEDFKKWRDHREANLKSAIDLRKSKNQAEFQHDTSQKLIFQSQKSQVKDQIVWDIKQRVKLLARSRNIDIIINGGINVSLPDINSDIKSMLANQ